MKQNSCIEFLLLLWLMLGVTLIWGGTLVMPMESWFVERSRSRRINRRRWLLSWYIELIIWRELPTWVCIHVTWEAKMRLLKLLLACEVACICRVSRWSLRCNGSKDRISISVFFMLFEAIQIRSTSSLVPCGESANSIDWMCTLCIVWGWKNIIIICLLFCLYFFGQFNAIEERMG